MERMVAPPPPPPAVYNALKNVRMWRRVRARSGKQVISFPHNRHMVMCMQIVSSIILDSNCVYLLFLTPSGASKQSGSVFVGCLNLAVVCYSLFESSTRIDRVNVAFLTIAQKAG